MKTRDTRLKSLEWKTRARLLQDDKQFFHSLSDAALSTLLSEASELDRELVCLIMAVPEALLVQTALELGHSG
jgi:hypothetical protein